MNGSLYDIISNKKSLPSIQEVFTNFTDGLKVVSGSPETHNIVNKHINKSPKSKPHPNTFTYTKRKHGK